MNLDRLADWALIILSVSVFVFLWGLLIFILTNNFVVGAVAFMAFLIAFAAFTVFILSVVFSEVAWRKYVR